MTRYVKSFIYLVGQKTQLQEKERFYIYSSNMLIKYMNGIR